jgi:Holliday junction DNA helicase RuvA
MIAWLTGKIKYKGEKFIILDVGDVGYKVFVSSKTLSQIKEGQSVEIFTHQHLREDVSDLFGFLTLEELRFFEAVISVAGVGPRVSMNILAEASILEIKKAIIRGDILFFDSIPGIGRKKAERFILELKDKIDVMPGEKGEKTEVADHDVVEALVKLGYGRKEAQQTVRQMPAEIRETKEKIKWALKSLGKNI